MNNNLDKKVERIKPKSLTTSKGSIYTYLPDGRTQRYKTKAKELCEPQDVIVFIPSWEEIKEGAQKNYPEIFGGIENTLQYEQLILEFAQTHGFTIHIVDGEGRLLLKNEDIENVERAFAHFIDKGNNRNNFFLPVRTVPKVGDYTYDSRYYKDGESNMHEQHIGNRVEEIDY